MGITVRTLTILHRLLLPVLFGVVLAATLLAGERHGLAAWRTRPSPLDGAAVPRALYLSAAATLEKAAAEAHCAVHTLDRARANAAAMHYRDLIGEAADTAGRLVSLSPDSAGRAMAGMILALIGEYRRHADSAIALASAGSPQAAAVEVADGAALVRSATELAERRGAELGGAVQAEHAELDRWAGQAVFHLYIYAGISLVLLLAGLVAVALLARLRLRDGHAPRARRASYAFRCT